MPNAKDIGAVYKELEFGLVSVIQCLMIPELRNGIVKYVNCRQYLVAFSFWMSSHVFNLKFLKVIISISFCLVFWAGLKYGF
jgi:hypothetical protein